MTHKQRAFIQYVQRTRPKTVEDLKPRYCARFLSQGAYRQTFTVEGLVIKFPTGPNPRRENIYHAQCEARAVRNLKRLTALKRYAPTILHFDRGRGVTIMPLYEKVKRSRAFKGFRDTFECMLADLIPKMRYGFDGGINNFGLSEQGYVVLDAGLIGETK